MKTCASLQVLVLSYVLLTLATPAFAQSGCGNNATPPLSGGGSVFGSIVSQWIQYFAQKIDVNNGVACNITLNGTISGTAFPFPPASLGTASTKNVGKSVNDPGTGSLENLVPVQTSTGAGPIAGISSGAYLQEKVRRSNSTTAMTDTLPASTITGLANGAQIDIANVDVSASDTISAGAGTTIASGSSYVLTAGRDIHLVYDLANTDWKFDANTSTALLNGGPLGTPSSATLTNATGYPQATAALLGISSPDNITIKATAGVYADQYPTSGDLMVSAGDGAMPTAYAGTSNSNAVLTALSAAGVGSFLSYANIDTASTLVQRDASGNFSAGTITASLTGHASLDLPLAGGNLTGTTELTGSGYFQVSSTAASSAQVFFGYPGGSQFEIYQASAGAPVVLGVGSGATLTFGSSAGSFTFAGLPTATGSYLCSTAGVISVEATACPASNMDMKNPLGYLNPAIASVRLDALQAAVYTYKDGDGAPGEHVGLYAQDVEKVDLRCASYDIKGKLQNYDPNCLIAYLISDRQEMKHEIATLQEREGIAADVCRLRVLGSCWF